MPLSAAAHARPADRAPGDRRMHCLPIPLTRCITLLPMHAPESTTATTAEIRAWAQERGFDVAARGRVPEAVKDLFEAKPAVVRDWASRNGIRIAERGPLPMHALEAYLARPAVVRRWARRRGLPVPERGRIPGDMVASYLAPYRALRQRGQRPGSSER